MFGIDISKKVFIITILIFIVLTTAFAFTYNIQLSNFLDLEQAEALNNVEKVQNVVLTEQSYLDNMVQDWACWDDTYRFIEDRNQDYINVDLQNQTLSGLKVNVMLFVNANGSLVYTKFVDIHTGEEKPVPSELLELVESGVLNSKSADDKINGYVLLEEDPMYISCHPILTTKYEGPVRGTLIFGRYFDDKLLDYFKENTCSSISMYRVDRDMPSDFQAKFQSFSEFPNRNVIEPFNEERVAGYFELKDVLGQPAIIMRADFPRDLYMNSKKALNYMYFFLLLTGLVTGIGVKIVLDDLFVSRLVEIDSFVTKVRSEKDLSKRLPLKGDDELYRLSKEINGMLNEIDLSEQELKSQEREKKVLLDSLNELVIFVDPQLKIIWANKAALEYMKVDLEQAKRTRLKSLGIKGPLAEYLQLEEIFKTGNKESGEFTSEDGNLWFVQANPITDENGKIIGILETCRDITGRKAIEKLLQEKQIAEISNRTKSEFLANMSHELRTPLNSIIGFSDLLVQQVFGELNEKQLKYAENISKSGRHLLNLINDILDLSKVEAGKMKLDYKEFELASKLNTIKTLMSPIADRKNIKIEIEVDSKLTNIRADEAKFSQIMYNLVDNAIKFSRENSSVKIGARMKGDWVEITVKDTGIGIKPEDQRKIFKPFSQVDSFASKQHQGTGLGLYLVKQIVHMHGGYIWFRSIPGEESTFAFAIPVEGKKSDGGGSGLDKKEVTDKK